jgi:hypothetical protein
MMVRKKCKGEVVLFFSHRKAPTAIPRAARRAEHGSERSELVGKGKTSKQGECSVCEPCCAV